MAMKREKKTIGKEIAMKVVALESCAHSNSVQVIAQDDAPLKMNVDSITFVIDKPNLPPEIGQTIRVFVSYEGEGYVS